MPSTERPAENLQDICRQIDDAKKEYDNLEMKKGESLRDFEYRVKRHSDKLLSLKVAEKVQRQLLEQGARDAEADLKKKLLIFEEPSPFRIRGWRNINILFPGGNEIPIVSRFFATNKTRSQKGKGFYPGLALLGISERISPATLGLLAKSAAAPGSIRDAQAALIDQGTDVSVTRISTAVRAAALQARSLRANDSSLETLEIQG
ncbi:MAG: hypothetical protein LBN39_05260, partial [Planctomycetaceae bacterium]|nr:hypothetical protein [Planctomycetaceae bacterium]